MQVEQQWCLGEENDVFQSNPSKVWPQWGKGGREVTGWENCDSNKDHAVLIIRKICNMLHQDTTTKNAHIHQQLASYTVTATENSEEQKIRTTRLSFLIIYITTNEKLCPLKHCTKQNMRQVATNSNRM